MNTLQHIAIIPDGNRRWATSLNLNPWDGHTEGAQRFWEIAEAIHTAGVKRATFWATSYDNINKRSRVEINFLLQLLRRELSEPRLLESCLKNKVRFQVLGEWSSVLKDAPTREAVEAIMGKTQQFTDKVLTILFVYDGQREMLAAVNKLIASGTPVDAPAVRKALWTGGLPDVDLVIRTGGEPHWSAGFMMWLTANSQFYFTNTLWPDFKLPQLQTAIEDYYSRDRRLGNNKLFIFICEAFLMLHNDLLQEIKQHRQHGDFIYPYYGRYSIAEIESSLRSYFKIPSSRNRLPDHFLEKHKQKKVVLFVIDGLGYHHLRQWGFGNPFFDKMIVFGDIYPITSVFPSTTPAALTSIHTGFTPQEHGLPEWFTFFPEFQKIILPMLFKPLKYGDREALLSEGGNPDVLYYGATKYTTMREHNIAPYVFLYEDHANVTMEDGPMQSTYTTAVQKGAEVITYREGFELMEKLSATLTDHAGSMFAHVYWGQVDKAGHDYGPGSAEHQKAIGAISELLYESFVKNIDPKVAEDVLVLLTADHGQIGVTAKDVFYLNDYPVAVELFDVNDKGEPILPTGSPNDVFLFIKPEHLAKVLSYLQHELKDIAEVMTTTEAVRRGLYGLNQPTERFLSRVGNILILPYPNKHVWYTEVADRNYAMKGIHGGLSEDEMIVPFGVMALSELQK